MATTTERAPRPQRKRAPLRVWIVAVAAVLGLFGGTALAASVATQTGAVEQTDQRIEKLPDSFQCLAGALAQAPIIFTVAAAPPPGLWTITLAGISSAIGLVQVVDACRDWITTPLGQVVIQGHCEGDAHCRGDGVTQRTFGYYAGGGGGGGGGGSW